MDNLKRLKKYEKCIHAFFLVRDGNIIVTCAPHAKTLGEMGEQAEEIDPSQCEHCEHYKSRCIEYPITVNSIKVDELKPSRINFSPVRVRPCSDDKTYFGILLGDFPHNSCVEYREETKELRVCYMTNPCILIPELKRVVFGSESWWSRIEDISDIPEISDSCINSQWYVKLLASMLNDECEKGEEEK